jgi:uncharacterized protein YndB with AHSA1/START domain/catechol 2,3-dioxygenase-like lactoylglutathione lyase family enzyme
MKTQNAVEPAHGREAVHSRVIAASPERLFKALSTATHLAKWWGPKGFSSTFETCDFRPGGRWVFVLHGPDGTHYPNENVFTEIVPARRAVIEHISETHHFFLTITFEAVDDGTKVGWRQVFDTAEHFNQVAPVILDANEQNLDRLAAEVRNVRSELLAIHPVLGATDVRASIDFFRRLGFELYFQDAPSNPKYAGVRRDGVELHLQWMAANPLPPNADHAVHRFIVTDVDELFGEFQKAGAIDPSSRSPYKVPADTPWGTREFHIRDPEGAGLQFYRPLNRQSSR